MIRSQTRGSACRERTRRYVEPAAVPCSTCFARVETPLALLRLAKHLIRALRDDAETAPAAMAKHLARSAFRAVARLANPSAPSTAAPAAVRGLASGQEVSKSHDSHGHGTPLGPSVGHFERADLFRRSGA